ncbi:hypothetical protein HHL28_15735 [Aerophototrophica crusticola]|uniref:Uncharacterized protein n=1 Tax=Aerophototrophica crusticola TaxID=1709002 RepID=A0A858RAY5_9PROT|nr:hypothetical protein HHL28_15735 [Rhodospirillaceae bacterium B3]
MRIGQGVSVSDELKFLEGALHQFHENLTYYAEAGGWEDLPHFYNERATLSFLAAAAWQKKLLAIEEFVNWKKKEDVDYLGRCDIWIAERDKQQSASIEVKQFWPKPGTRSETFSTWLSHGDKAAAGNPRYGFRVAMTFFSPVIPVGSETGETLAVVRKIAETVERDGSDGIAWWFPDAAMERGLPRRDGKGMAHWPGLLTVMRNLGQASRRRTIIGRPFDRPAWWPG